ncbi:L,D-transpeptidase [Egicoccus sp. AB-alg2]|uniref:L,D-transpeptidase n=1 Tax=Egicoccus sp. AB-alg2 TaxID=3242693 RepID=UPI00359E3C1B
MTVAVRRPSTVRLLCLLLAVIVAFTTTSSFEAAPAEAASSTALPAKSGTGKRIVYSRVQQRVWLVRGDDTVKRTYLVSGHRHGTLPPVGTHSVRSKSATTTSLDGRLTMKYMTRFYWAGRAWVGFHSIPVDRAGNPIQSTKQLGTPLSSGCVRQAEADARALYDFAKVGTKVVVVK